MFYCVHKLPPSPWHSPICIQHPQRALARKQSFTQDSWLGNIVHEIFHTLLIRKIVHKICLEIHLIPKTQSHLKHHSASSIKSQKIVHYKMSGLKATPVIGVSPPILNWEFATVCSRVEAVEATHLRGRGEVAARGIIPSWPLVPPLNPNIHTPLLRRTNILEEPHLIPVHRE